MHTPLLSNQTLALKIISSVYLLLAVLLCLFTIYLCYEVIWQGPFRDLWEFIGIIETLFQWQELASIQWPWQELIQPYGGIHRIFFPKLLFYLDYRFFNGTNIFPLTLTLSLHITACFLFCRSIYKQPTTNLYERWILYATCLLFFFSTTQIYNLIYISDNQVPLSNSFSVLALWFFYRYQAAEKTYHSKYLYISNILIIIASLNHSSGLMAWPALLIMMCLLRNPKKELAIQIGLMGIWFWFYLYGLQQTDSHSVETSRSLINTLLHPFISALLNAPGILKYIGLHLSSPTGKLSPLVAIIISYTSIVYLLSLWSRVYFQNRAQSDSQNDTKINIFWLSLTSYIFCISLVTAYGRQIYPGSALTDRYQTLIMTYWAALFLLLYFDMRKKSTTASAIIIPLLCCLFLVPHQYRAAKEMAWLSSRVQQAHSAAMVNITDMKTISATLSHPLLKDNKNMVAKHQRFLKENTLGFYQHEHAQQFSKPFKGKIIHTECPSQIQSIQPMTEAGQYKILGHSTTTNQANNEFLFVDNQSIVIGLARRHRLKENFLPLSYPQRQQPWIGFINNPIKSQPIHSPIRLLAKQGDQYCEALIINSLQKP